MIRYYVVKSDGRLEIWAMTAEEMYHRTHSDRTLEARLDHHPFDTRAAAELRIAELRRTNGAASS